MRRENGQAYNISMPTLLYKVGRLDRSYNNQVVFLDDKLLEAYRFVQIKSRKVIIGQKTTTEAL